MKYILKNHKTKKVACFYGDTYLLSETNNQVAVIGNFGIGAPVVATILEELIAFGVKNFISVGTAGSLQKNIAIGDIIVCEKAIRDEGTSHHYLKASKYAVASKEMVSKIKESLQRRGLLYHAGTSWTIDAPYRETVAEARQYQREGVLTVEMEASALFAIARYRKVKSGAVFTVSDSLAELEWNVQFHSKNTKGCLVTLYHVALDALLDRRE